MRAATLLLTGTVLLAGACGEGRRDAPPAAGPESARPEDPGVASGPATPSEPAAARVPLAEGEVRLWLEVLRAVGPARDPTAFRDALVERGYDLAAWAALEGRIAAARAALRLEGVLPVPDAWRGDVEAVRPFAAQIDGALGTRRLTGAVRIDPAPKPAARPGSPRPLTSEDVEDYLAVLEATAASPGDAAALAETLKARDVSAEWFRAMEERIPLAAFAVVRDPAAPVPESWLADREVVAPYRQRLEKALAPR